MKALKEREHKVIYKDGDKVVKVFDETFSKADVLNEALNMARVEETGLRIPKLLNVSKVDGKWAITREYIEGTPPEPADGTAPGEAGRVPEYLCGYSAGDLGQNLPPSE